MISDTTNNFDHGKVISQMEAKLQIVWRYRNPTTNTMIVIGDGRRADIVKHAASAPSCKHTILDSHGRPQEFYAYLQPLELIKVLKAENRVIAQDLRKMEKVSNAMNLMGGNVVVVLIVLVEFLCATLWSPDGSVVNVMNESHGDEAQEEFRP